MTSDRSSGGSQPGNWRKRLCRLLGREPQSKTELIALIHEAERDALIDREAVGMIEGVMQVSDLRVGDIMIPRAEMIAIRRDEPLERIIEIAVESAHSRFPVIAEDKGEVVGIILAKDLLAYCSESQKHNGFNIRDHIRSAVFVPESKRLNVLLKEFRASRNHMAVVVDEYGSASGLVTIEDVLEQIVGDIEDEHDHDEGAFIFKRGRGEYTLKARTPVEDFNEYFDSALNDSEFDTIGGLVINAFGHLPGRGERVELEGFRFHVVRADSRRLHLLTVRRVQGEQDESATIDSS